MASAGDRLKAALDGLIYLPSLQAGGDAGGTPTEAPSSASPGSAVAAAGAPVLCRPWDRADLLRRLQSFRAASWFCKPAPLGPVPCAMRGWINAATDTLKCEVRGEEGRGGEGGLPGVPYACCSARLVASSDNSDI